MYPKQNRLPRYAFRTVFDTGTRLHGYDMTVIVATNDGGFNRFGVVVGKTVHKHAVIRNRIKRLIRNALTHLLPLLTPHVDMVIIAKKNFAGDTEEKREQIIKDSLEKLHCIQHS